MKVRTERRGHNKSYLCACSDPSTAELEIEPSSFVHRLKEIHLHECETLLQINGGGLVREERGMGNDGCKRSQKFERSKKSFEIDWTDWVTRYTTWYHGVMSLEYVRSLCNSCLYEYTDVWA